MRKSVFVDQLKQGQRVDESFMVKSARLSETKAGKPYLILVVMDRSGEVSGPIWDNALGVQKICEPGEIVGVTGLVQSYRDNLQLKIDSVLPVPKEMVELGDYFPVSPKNRQEMTDELQLLLYTVKNPYLKKLLNYFFNTSDWWLKFQEAPAAKGIHHAYIGGLLEHSLSVAQLCNFMAKHYEGVDHSLLLAGALLHDIGKLEELRTQSGVVDYTVAGRLKGHLVIGSEMISEAAGQIKGFPQELLEQLQHLILSHHGRQEFGSPTVPMTVEAFVLSFVDDLDAKMNLTEQLRRKMNSEEMGWTEYQRTLERYLYLGGFEDKSPPVEKLEPARSRRQPSLFS